MLVPAGNRGQPDSVLLEDGMELGDVETSFRNLIALN